MPSWRERGQPHFLGYPSLHTK